MILKILSWRDEEKIPGIENNIRKGKGLCLRQQIFRKNKNLKEIRDFSFIFGPSPIIIE